MSSDVCKNCGCTVEREIEMLSDLAFDLETVLDEFYIEQMADGIREMIRKIRCIRDGKHFPVKLIKKKPGNR